MTALLEWLDAPREMVKAKDQQAGPRPTVEELDWMFQSASDRMEKGLRVEGMPQKTWQQRPRPAPAKERNGKAAKRWGAFWPGKAKIRKDKATESKGRGSLARFQFNTWKTVWTP